MRVDDLALQALARKISNIVACTESVERPIDSEASQGNEPSRIRVESLKHDAPSDFDNVLAAIIDRTISMLLGPRVLAALYRHLEEHYSITKETLPANLRTLCVVLQRTIGFAASETVERAIAKALYTRLGLRFGSESRRSLPEYVDNAKRTLASER